MKITDNDCQKILRHVRDSYRFAIFVPDKLGGSKKYVSITYAVLLDEKDKVRNTVFAGVSIGRKAWWERYGDEARRLKLKGPQLEKAAKKLTPELMEWYTLVDWPPTMVNYARGRVNEVLQFLYENGHIVPHEHIPWMATITNKGRNAII